MMSELVFLTNSAMPQTAEKIEAWVGETISIYPFKFLINRKPKVIRINNIHDWAVRKNISMKFFCEEYWSEIYNKKQYRCYYEFERSEDAVECVLLFGDGKMYEWSVYDVK